MPINPRDKRLIFYMANNRKNLNGDNSLIEQYKILCANPTTDWTAERNKLISNKPVSIHYSAKDKEHFSKNRSRYLFKNIARNRTLKGDNSIKERYNILKSNPATDWRLALDALRLELRIRKSPIRKGYFVYDYDEIRRNIQRGVSTSSLPLDMSNRFWNEVDQKVSVHIKLTEQTVITHYIPE